MTMLQRQNKQRGAVSLFIVIFTALLITIVTISFVQLMLHDQQQATTSDLSQSAYDSAQAGVEDAKRALLRNQACNENPAGAGCAALQAALASGTCDSVSTALGILQVNHETLIQQDESDQKLDQAYTCVKVAIDTPDYVGTIESGDSQLIPLKGGAPFDRIELNWFTTTDFSSPDGSQLLAYPSNGSNVQLPKAGAGWPSNAPALMRTQLIQTGSSFNLSDFDDASAGKNNANTVFLYPSPEVGTNATNFANDVRRSGAAAPLPVNCHRDLTSALYACTITMTLPEPIGGTSVDRTAFLRLSALYNKSTFQIKLKNGGSDVKFSGVQSEVDSTGRANDLFRRVKSRITLGGDFPYPQAAIDIEGDLCKNFTITDDTNNYRSAACNY